MSNVPAQQQKKKVTKQKKGHSRSPRHSGPKDEASIRLRPPSRTGDDDVEQGSRASINSSSNLLRAAPDNRGWKAVHSDDSTETGSPHHQGQSASFNGKLFFRFIMICVHCCRGFLFLV